MSPRRLAFFVLAAALLAVAPASAADEVKLRGWYVGIQMARGGRDGYDVFARPGLPPAEVEEAGRGGGFQLGHRFGDRFLLGLQVAMTRHEIDGTGDHLYNAEALVTGTVLFNERKTFQPFLRGGFGGAATVLEFTPDNEHVTAYGTAAVAGGGFQVRASSRVSFEAEAVATFTNFLEVSDDRTGATDEVWQVRTSHVGWRLGLGASFWF